MTPARFVSLALLLAAFAWPGGPAAAQSLQLPVPAMTIYPGDVIEPAFVTSRTFPASMLVRGAAPNLEAVIGKVARRTLLPEQPIPVNALGEPNIIARGASVQVVFREGGLVITAYGSALEPGRVGDVVRVRNIDTGLVIFGVIQSDGTVRVGAG
ncbi:flagellar basal body P-ring formation chaperone FlgA [Propylenella binzhouense]|uniref:Flagella basal body P-ring formation protein FlgA n=1 Tax=Propylenella binzhouense TaxID=2555902 RepID=A0A964T234_9HYPH|nr:flagellar basal body P-ring formation chaperone FlgA [Propylenella binzhouense]MYZ46978.1 flagellar basal body P-ring formation protein FlgA [Propylenella binzhouense]